MKKMQRILCVSFVVLSALLLCGYLVLSKTDFMAGYVSEKFAAALNGIAPLSYEAAAISGNPITGVIVEEMTVGRDQMELIRAKEVELNVDLASVLSEPRLSSLIMRSVDVDLDGLTAIMDGANKSSSPPAVRRVILENINLRSKNEIISGAAVEFARIDISGANYSVSAKVFVMGRGLSLEADAIVGQSGPRVVRAVATAEGISMTARETSSGTMIDIKELDLTALSDLFKDVNHGLLPSFISGKVMVASYEPIILSADLEVPKYTYQGVEFGDIKGMLNYSNGQIVAERLTANTCGGELDASGVEFQPLKIAYIKGSELDLDKLSALLSMDVEMKGRASVSGSIKTIKDRIAVDARLSSQSVTVNAIRADDVSCEINNDAGVYLIKGRCRTFGGALNFSGSCDLTSGLSADITADIKNMKPEYINRYFPGNVKNKLGGTIDAHAEINIVKNGICVGGKAFSSDFIVDDSRFDKASVVFALDDSKIKFDEVSIVYNGASLKGVGDLVFHDDARPIEVSFTGNIADLFIERFSKYAGFIEEHSVKGVISGGISVAGPIEDVAAVIELSSPQIRIDKIALDRPVLTALVDAKSLDIKRASMKIFDTDIDISGAVLFASKDITPQYRIAGTGKNISSERIKKHLPIPEDLTFDGDMIISINNDSSGSPEIEIELKEAKCTYSPFINNASLDGQFRISENRITVIDLKNLAMNEVISLSGDIELSNDPLASKIDMNAHIASTDIGRISRIFDPMAKGYEGIASGHAKITGTISDPKFISNVNVRFVRAFGLFLPEIAMSDITYSNKIIDIPVITARVGRGTVDGAASVDLRAAPMFHIAAEGKNVGIRSLAFNLERDVRREIKGTVDFDFTGNGWLDTFEGSGKLYVPEFQGFGIDITDLSAEFNVTDGFVLIEDSRGRAYDGELTLQAAKDLKLTKWGGRVEIKSGDLSSFMKSMFPDLEGEMTGRGDLLLRIGGDTGRTSLLDAAGFFDIYSGSVRGFSATETLSKMNSGRPVSFEHIHVPFRLDSKTAYLLPGARITSSPSDKLFKYIALDGNYSIDDGSFFLSCLGNINIRALNSFLGGLQNIVAETVKNNAVGSKEQILQGFIGGAISGFSRTQFKDISLNIVGNKDDFRVRDFSINEPTKIETKPDVLTEEKENEDEENRFKLKVEIPVGPGGSKEDDVQGQLSGQIIEQALKSLLKY